jgi:ABC-type lipoprotein release transport system permease subunit
MRTWIEKQLAMLDFTLASLARRKARNLGLLVVFALLVFLLASVMLFTRALRREAASVLAGTPEVILQRMVAGRHDLIPPGYLEGLGRIRGVQKVEGRLWGYYYDPVVRANYTFMVTPSAPAEGTLAIGPALARARSLAVGDTLAFRSYAGELRPFTIAGILPQATELASADLVLVCEKDFRSFFAYPEGCYTDLALSVANPLEARTVASKLVRAHPEIRTILREDVLRTYASLFDWREGVVLALFSGALLAFAILAWDKASGLSAEERREIGILKAIGWETGDVLRMKAWEETLLALTAFLVGHVAAYLHVFHFGAGLFEPVLRGWSALYPRFRLTPTVDGVDLLTLLLLTCVPYTVAVLVPTWRAATTDPDSVMRS